MSITHVCAGTGHTCALSIQGKLKCFGYNYYGQLGIPDYLNRGDQPNEMGHMLPFVDYGAGIEPTALVCGYSHTCLHFDTFQTKCFGSNSNGDLVLGDNIPRGLSPTHMGENLPFSKWGAGRTVKQVFGGIFFTCAILDNDTVKCAGYNANGRLGYGDTSNRGSSAGTVDENLPVVDFGASGIPIKLSKGSVSEHACIIFASGLKCWGKNDRGQLGLGNTQPRGDNPGEMGDSLLYVNIGTGRTAEEVVVGREHTCVIRDDQSTVCWGFGQYGQLARGNTLQIGDSGGEMGDSLLSMQLGTSRNAIGIALGSEYSCALLDNNAVKCFGRNSNGISGQGPSPYFGDSPSTIGDNLPPIDLGTNLPVEIVFGGENHACVLFRDSVQVKCWGKNEVGQLGLGDLVSRGANIYHMGMHLPFLIIFPGESQAPTEFPSQSPTVPTPPNTDTPTTPYPTRAPTAPTSLPSIFIKQICVGNSHTCALSNSGAVKCFGYNFYGQLGLGHALALGDGPNEMGGNLPFVNVCIGLIVSEIACGGMSTCALFTTGESKCWGNNGNGQLVLGDTEHRGRTEEEMGNNLPFSKWGTGRTVKQLVAGGEHTCAILENDDVKCAGGNFDGRLGLGDTTDRGTSAPTVGDNLPTVKLGTGRTAVRLFSGAYSKHNCALLDDDSLKCWGLNFSGQLGLNDFHNRGDEADEMGDDLPAVNLGTGRRAVQVAVGVDHTCAIRDDEKAVCWGYNGFGELGRGSSVNAGDGLFESGLMGNALVPMLLGSGLDPIQITCGWRFTCVLLSTNGVKCFGLGNSGQPGQGSLFNQGYTPANSGDNLPMIHLGTGLEIQSVHAGSQHACVLFKETILAKCWGQNGSGHLGLGNTITMGDQPNEMGSFLPFVDILETPAPTLSPSPAPTASPTPPTPEPTSSPTVSPTLRPSVFPSISPTARPTASPTQSPTKKPTKSPTLSPTQSPIPPTLNPTNSPQTQNPTGTPTTTGPTRSPSESPSEYPTTKNPTISPSTSPITSSPTTSAPSVSPVTPSLATATPTRSPSRSPVSSPTFKVLPYVSPKSECNSIRDPTKCEQEANSLCGQCQYLSEKVSYSFRAQVNFVMEGTKRFLDFDNTATGKTQFVDSIRALLKKNINGLSSISVTRFGQIEQVNGQANGFAKFDISFYDSESDKTAAKTLLQSKSNAYDYLDDLNAELNKKMKTTGEKYMSGEIHILSNGITDVSNGKGACICASDEASGAISVQPGVSLLSAISIALISNLLHNH